MEFFTGSASKTVWRKPANPLGRAEGRGGGHGELFRSESKRSTWGRTTTARLTASTALQKIDGRLTDGWLMSSPPPPFEHFDSDHQSPEEI